MDLDWRLKVLSGIFLVPEALMNDLAGYSFVFGTDICLRKDLLRQPETIYKADS